MRESIFGRFFGGRSKSVGFFTWLKLIALEVYLGEHLIEMIGNTSSFKEKSDGASFGDDSNGAKEPLEYFIPATFINKLIKSHIENLLKLKYCNHYQLIRVADLHGEETNGRYEANPNSLYMLTELKLAYNTTWTALNIAIDVAVFVITNDLMAAIVAGGVIELFRRLKL